MSLISQCSKQLRNIEHLRLNRAEHLINSKIFIHVPQDFEVLTF